MVRNFNWKHYRVKSWELAHWYIFLLSFKNSFIVWIFFIKVRWYNKHYVKNILKEKGLQTFKKKNIIWFFKYFSFERVDLVLRDFDDQVSEMEESCDLVRLKVHHLNEIFLKKYPRFQYLRFLSFQNKPKSMFFL
jgi:hypothetical protein